MSRIGKKPIPVPQGVTVKIDGNLVAVQGPQGKLDTPIPAGIKLEQARDLCIRGWPAFSSHREFTHLPVPCGVIWNSGRRERFGPCGAQLDEALGEFLAITLAVVSLLMLGWELLFTFHVLPIKLDSR